MPSELQALVDASLDFWLTTGRYAAEFEREFARWIGVRHAILVNSGSSANLLALTTLTADELGERRLRPGDEVITAAAGFPTTVNPIIQNRLVPVFVDSTLPTYNADPDAIEAAVGPRTRAIMIAHTLGNPFDLDRIRAIAERHGLWLDRGHLRRRRFHVARQEGGDLRRPRHGQLLPRAPHHHG